MKQRLVEKESTVKSGQTQFGDGHAAATNNNQLHVAPSATAAGVTQGKEALVVSIQPDQATSSDFDSAIGGVLSVNTVSSSKASQSDIEFSESYL